MAKFFGKVIIGLLLLTMVIAEVIDEKACKRDCIYPKTDIVFALDESGGSLEVFDQQKKLINHLLTKFDIGPNYNQVGAVTIGAGLTKHFYLGEYTNHSAIQAAVNNITPSSPRGGIAFGLSHMNEDMFDANNGARNNVNKVAFVITYGGSITHYDMQMIADRAKEKGIVMLAIGIHRSNSLILRVMAQSMRNIQYLNTFYPSNWQLERMGLLSCTDVCPNGWTLVSGVCYLIVSCPLLTQDEALEACDAEGGDLLRIYRFDEFKALRAHILGDPMLCYPKYWTGGYEPNNDGNWYWRRFDGAHFKIWNHQLYWATDEPNERHNDSEHCINLLNLHGRDYYYNDANCNRKMGYICKMSCPIMFFTNFRETDD